MEGIMQALDAARRGDPEAWQTLHQAFQPFLLQQAQRRLGPGWPEWSGQDLVQDTWIRAMSGLADFQGGPDDRQTAALFRAWLRTIMKHLHANLVRADGAARRKPPAALVALDAVNGREDGGRAGDVPGRECTGSAVLARTEEQERVLRALARLPELEREAVRLHVLEGLSLADVAARLGVTLHVARYRKDEGLRLLGGDLGPSP